MNVQISPIPKVIKANRDKKVSNEPELYVLVSWPDIQDYMSDPRWSECIFCQNIDNHPVEDGTFAVPFNLYKKYNK